jgi:hypothetical protein
MENPQNSKIAGVEEILNAVKAFGNEKGIIIDIQLPGDVQTPVELWSGIKTKADTRRETKDRKKWKQQTQGKGSLLLTGRVNALSLVERIISEIERPVQLLRLREVIDFRYRARVKMKLYFLSATWRPRNTDESDNGATAKVNLRQLWERRPPALSRVLDQIYKVQIYDNPDGLVVRLILQQPY